MLAYSRTLTDFPDLGKGDKHVEALPGQADRKQQWTDSELLSDFFVRPFFVLLHEIEETRNGWQRVDVLYVMLLVLSRSSW